MPKLTFSQITWEKKKDHSWSPYATGWLKSGILSHLFWKTKSNSGVGSACPSSGYSSEGHDDEATSLPSLQPAVHTQPDGMACQWVCFCFSDGSLRALLSKWASAPTALMGHSSLPPAQDKNLNRRRLPRQDGWLAVPSLVLGSSKACFLNLSFHLGWDVNSSSTQIKWCFWIKECATQEAEPVFNLLPVFDRLWAPQGAGTMSHLSS